MNRASVTYNTKFPEGRDMSGNIGKKKKKNFKKKDCDLPNLVKNIQTYRSEMFSETWTE